MKKIVLLICFFLTTLSPAACALEDISGTLTSDETSQIRKTVAACADIMSFDIKDYDYDKLFTYILYTHENFGILTDLDSDTRQSSVLGYNSVSLVKSDYIDFIMNNVFDISPEKPPVSSLTSRGFCYNDGYYLYTGGFDVYFATELGDIKSVKDIGMETLLVNFSDIYREGNTKTEEDSFAILRKNGDTYFLLRLGMNEAVPSEAELLSYLPQPDGDTNAESGDIKNNFLMSVLLIVFSAALVGLSVSAVFLSRTRSK